MGHNAQVILAFGISAVLCLIAWSWARHRLAGSSHQESKYPDAKKEWSDGANKSEGQQQATARRPGAGGWPRSPPPRVRSQNRPADDRGLGHLIRAVVESGCFSQ